MKTDYIYAYTQIPICDNFIETGKSYIFFFPEFISIILHFFNKIFTCGYMHACVCVGLENFVLYLFIFLHFGCHCK